MTAVLFQSMPPLSPEEYAALEASIREHGVLVPVILDEDGVTIDGHHRRKIAEHLGVECPTEVREGLTDAEKRTLALSLNVDRRHLSREQRRDLIAASLKADPQLSDREHARRTGADHKTVGGVRESLESGGEIPHLDYRDNPQGRQQPASKPDRSAPEPEPAPEFDATADDAEDESAPPVPGFTDDEDDEPALTEEECEALADPDDLGNEPEPEPEPQPDAPGPRAQANQQRRVIEKAAGVLGTYAGVFPKSTVLLGAVTQEEAAQWVGDFSKGIRALSRIKRLLEELASTREEV